ncbi:MAG: hypothetical protein IPJ40_07430 [Saprospirales bacterium]|nr:hypothetical protein [Saprospirales bacterium]
MKKTLYTLLSFSLMLSGLFHAAPASAQHETAIRLTLDHLQARCTDYGITTADVADVWVTSAYSSKKSGITHVYFSQQYQGIEVLQAAGNANIDRNGALINMNVRFVRNLAGKSHPNQPGYLRRASGAGCGLPPGYSPAAGTARGERRRRAHAESAVCKRYLCVGTDQRAPGVLPE